MTESTNKGGVTLVPSRTGAPSLQVTCPDGSAKTLHSLYDPEKEARTLVDRCSFQGQGLIVVLGLGLGYHVLELARRFPETELVVVEASEEIHALARESGNLDALAQGTTFLVGLAPDEALRRITRLQIKSGMKPLFVFPLSAAVSVFPREYEPLTAALARATTVKLWDRLKYPKFREESVSVLLVDFDYFLTREIQRAGAATGHRVSRVRIRKGESGEAIVARLMEAILASKPDFLVTLNHLGFDEDGVLTSFLRSIEMPAASWFVDSPNLIVREFKANVSPYTTVFLWDRSYAAEMEAMGFEGVTYLPLATDAGVFRPLPAHRRKKGVTPCDVGFVGNSMVEAARERLARVAPELRPLVERLAVDPARSRDLMQAQTEQLDPGDRARIATLGPRERIDLEAAVLWTTTLRYRLRCLEKLVDLGLRVHGDDGWRQLLPDPAILRPGLAYYDQLPWFYNRCKINFNATSLQMGAAVNQRVFDVPACGAFLLTDRQEALGELFEVGTEVIAFTDVDEIPDLAAYHLRHPEARQAVARRGRSRVLREHTYRHRFNRIVEVMRAAHARR